MTAHRTLDDCIRASYNTMRLRDEVPHRDLFGEPAWKGMSSDRVVSTTITILIVGLEDGMSWSTHLDYLVEGKRSMDRKRFLFFLLGIITVSMLVLVSVTFFLRSRQASSGANAPYQGTDLGGVSAPDFRLVDQTGTSLTLSHMRGRPVVLTFLYTHCPGPCPLTAQKLGSAIELLGAQADQVTWVAVSLDPKGDTPASATAFVETHRLTGRLHYLLGTRTELEPTWKAYAVGVQSLPTTPSTVDSSIMHTSGAFVIDQAGRERFYLGDTFTPALLVTKLRMLLAQ